MPYITYIKKIIFIIVITFFLITLIQCKKENTEIETDPIKDVFGTNIDLNNLYQYANQTKPAYITKDNTGNNPVIDAKATIGRVLFYDKNMSIDNSISCASCHKQEFAFGDTAKASRGVSGGFTTRHSMRLVNARFSAEIKFFWDERAISLEKQTTQPIQDHSEMGFSGKNGRPTITDLINKLQKLSYYTKLFQFAYKNTDITEERMQECLAQFVRSIQSFDSDYDIGRATANNENQNFSNFSAQQNTGKNLFLSPPVFDNASNRIVGGLGCGQCHRPPEFDIDPNTKNNGIIGIINNPDNIDITNTRSPSIRDIVNPNGSPNTAMMHTAGIITLQAAIGHYGTINIAHGNTNLDARLRPNGIGQKLNLNEQEVNAVITFLKTLTGKNIYTDKKWSNPFLSK